ncbi:MAG: hypothetical protein HOP23_17385 [Methylococcaceae bacterium]|nr:hypothetical protein [Methylococcaceae bacterium]
MKQAKFGYWLQQSLLFVSRDPMVWISYTLFVAVILIIGRISPAIGIFSAVVCLFVGVGVVKYIDLKASPETAVGFFWAIRQSLPLAVLAATGIVLFWFVFMAIANIISGNYYKIGLFFFNWELTPSYLNHKSVHDIASWLYAYANVALIFILLMLITLGSWFSYPLMLFSNYRWSEAKAQGKRLSTNCQGSIYRMLGFIFLNAILCSSVIPLLTPVLYMLVSTMMYISYKDRIQKLRI